MANLALIQRDDGSFIPAFNSDWETARKIKRGEAYVYEYKKPRNLKFLRKFFALINLVYANQDHYNNDDHLRYDLLIRAGYYDVHYDFEGKEIVKARSISFDKMTEEEFNDCYNAVVRVVTGAFGILPETIEEEILQYF